MADFLSAIINNLPQGYQRALEDVSRRRDLREETSLDVDALVEDLVERARRPSFTPIFEQIRFLPDSTIRAEDFQQMLVELYVDLQALYQQNNRIDAFTGQFYEVVNSTHNKVKKNLLRLNESVAGLLVKQQNPEFNEVKILSFQQATNYHNEANKAQVEVETGLVGAQPVIIKRLAQRKGPLSPVLSTRLLTAGVPGNAVRTFSPDKAVSADPRCFWMDIVLSETLVKSKYNGTDHNGPITEFTIKLPQADIVNQIRLKQLTRFPMKLLDIRYRIGDQVRSINNFEVQTLTDDLVEINFEATRINDIRLILLQEGYREINVHIPRQLQHQQQILDLLFRRSMETVMSQNEIDFGKVNEALRLLDKANQLDPNDLQDTTRKVFLELTGDSRLLSNTSLVADGAPTRDNEEEIIELQRYEYQFGLQMVEVNRVHYSPQSVFVGERLQTNGNPLVFALEVDETSVELDATLSEESEIQYDMEISERRTFPILPEGTTQVVSERIFFDQETRVGKSRFPHSAVDFKLYRNGVLVEPGNYTAGGGSDSREITISGGYNKFTPAAIFVATYDLLETFESVDITELFNSTRPEEPEIFVGTDENNQISLLTNPFVLPDIVFDTERWLKRDPRDARYEYVPRQGSTQYIASNAAHDPPVIELDGQFYGSFQATSASAINAFQTSISFTTDIPPSGKFMIDAEIISYTRDSIDTKKAICARGADGTTPENHAAGIVKWIAAAVYEPVEVLVNGIRAHNLTDYAKGEHNAFQQTNENSDIRTYVQIGKRIYFDSRVRGNISVNYRRMADFVRLRATFNQHSTRERFYSSKLSTAIVKLKSVVT